MLERLTLKFGERPGAEPLSFEPGSLTVVVGPNNSGKSLFVHELGFRLLQPGHHPNVRILDTVEHTAMSIEDIRALLETWESLPVAGNANERQYVIPNPGVPGTGGSIQIRESELRSGAATANLIPRLLVFLTLRLDGASRLSILSQAESHPLAQHPRSILMALLKDDERRARVREHSARAFGVHFVVDVTGLKTVQARMSARPPATITDERGIDAQSVAFHEAAELLDGFSDGVRAYMGIVAAAICSEYRVLLIDEPEAFLHPPLQRDLGNLLARMFHERGGLLFAATHSADFLMGCVQSGVPVNVLRLTYDRGAATARMLASSDLLPLTRDPLMRSARFLNAIFHRGAVVCEGDTDRVLYEETAYRIGTSNELKPSDVLFLNGNGKTTIPKLIAALRRLGLPAAAIVDLDIIKEGDLGQLLRAAGMPGGIVEAVNAMKARVRRAFDDLDRDPKMIGISVLSADVGAEALHMIAAAAEYGVFIVDVGALEGWLSTLGASGRNKSERLASLLEKLGSDADADGYVRPGEGDVWAFVRKVLGWIADPNRKGV